jgi:simple sugar transport system permease protein
MLSVGNVGLFTEGMSGGRGFIALAAVIFGGWRPWGVLGAALIFGGADALQLRLQAQTAIPSQVWVALLLIPIILLVHRLARRRAREIHAAAAAFGGAVFVAGLTLSIAAPRWRLPSEFWLMLPYAITLVVLTGLVGRPRLPAALGLPYRRAASGA